MLALAGCTGLPTEPSLPAPTAPERISMTDCRGIEGLTYVESGILPTPPAGWERGAASPTGALRLRGFVCADVAVGEVRAGPVSFTFEHAENHAIPEGCAFGGFDESQLLVRVVVSDGDVADVLRARFAMPVNVGLGSFQEVQLGAVYDRSWTFGLPDAPSSRIAQQGVPVDSGTTSHTFRLVWANAYGGVTLWDLADELSMDLTDARLIWGAVQPPFLYAKAALPAYWAYGFTFGDGRLKGSILEFTDNLCSHPLHPN